MLVRSLALLSFLVCCCGAAWSAANVDLTGSFVQGGMIKGKTTSDVKIFLDNQELFVGPSGDFVFGFGRDAPATATLCLLYSDGQKDCMPLSVVPQAYAIEHVDGLRPETVSIPEEQKARRDSELAQIQLVRAERTLGMGWSERFALPAQGPITGVYGSQRILNGEPSYPHYGLDISGPVGTPVFSPASGTVVLAERDFLLEGGLLIIDHGFQVFSTLMHLSDINVDVGQTVDRGTLVGAIGATGRANGPHLDWRVNWGEVRLDPSLLSSQTKTINP